MDELICVTLTVYWFILIARVILSWVQVFGGQIPPAIAPLAELVYRLTEPLAGFLRRYIPPMGGFDISILFVFIILGIFQRAICAGV